MKFVKIYKESFQPTIFLFSNYDTFALYLLENLLSNLCKVIVFCEDLKIWKNNTTHITKTDNLIFDFEKNLNKYPKPDYFLVVNLLETQGSRLIEKTKNLSTILNAKGFVIVSDNCKVNYDSKLIETVGIIILSNLFGPRMGLDEKSRISQIISAAIQNKKLKILEEEKISPVYMGDAAKLIIKWLFSFGPYGEFASISSGGLSISNICGIVKKVYPDFRYRVASGYAHEPVSTKNEIYLLEKNPLKSFEETLLWLKKNNLPKVISQKTKHKNSWSINILLVLSLILATPFVLIIFSVFLLYISVRIATADNFKLAHHFVDSAHIVSSIANKESKILAGVPVLDKLYVPATNLSYIIENLSGVGQSGFNLIKNSYRLTDNILGEGEYDLEEIQKNITSDLSRIEVELSFAEGELKNYPNLYKKINLVQVRKLISNFNKISLSLSDILGAKKTMTYLILFQNNMELRPAGGFIGSFALATFSSGKLNEINVQDVYSADGQLKGHVEPPVPIKKYLKEANWFLRDSNWSSDFSVSAKQAEWFLDKEIDISVDGVIAIDLNVIKDFLQIVGPIYLTDYQTQISFDNFYEKTQTEVEGDFFPGSTKKANFITALTKEMINTLLINKENNKAKLAKIVYDNLEARHIQIYLHNGQINDALNNLNWGGVFNYPNCQGNCLSDFLGIVEANLGVNKVNYYIERKYDLSVNIRENLVNSNLLITYKNKASLAMGNNGIYKNYMRLVLPLNSSLDFVKVGDTQLETDVEIVEGKKEIGFYFELLPEQTKTISASWRKTQPLSVMEAGEYLMYVKKQAGVSAEPININFSTIPTVDLKVEPGYNTLFSKDIYSKVTWKK